MDGFKGGATVKTYVFGIELQQEADGRWSVWIPGLSGCASWGHTKEEALRNIQDAAELYVEDMLETGQAIPAQAGRVEVLERPAIAVTV